MPSKNPLISSALAKVITDSEGEESSCTPRHHTPVKQLSGTFRDHSDQDPDDS